MKKITLFLVIALCSLVAKAQTGDPIMTMKAEPGRVLDFELMCATAGQTMYVDWGDGVVQQYDSIANAIDDYWGTTVADTVRGEGNIAIYGDATQFCYFSSIWSAAWSEDEEDGSKILSVDVSKATELTDLTLQSHALTSIDVSNLTKLTSLIVMCDLTEIDLSKNPDIKTLTLSENYLQSLDLSHLSKLKTLRLNENRGLTNETLKLPTETGVLTSVYALGLGLSGKVDFSMYPKITTLSLNDNPGITSVDARGMILTSLTCLDCSSLTEILVDSVRMTFNVRNTPMSPATLPALNVKNFYYDPLLPYDIPTEVQAGESIDLSSQYIVRGDTSTYTWKYTDGSVVDASYYTEDKGVFTFKVAPKDTVYCEITVPAYPKLKGNNAYVTTKTVADGAKEIMTMTAEPGKALDFELKCAAVGQSLYIDWGNGVVQQYDSIAQSDEYWGTEIADTVRGEGNISIYGDASQLSYLSSIWSAAWSEDEEDGSKITAIDLSKAIGLEKLVLQSHNLATLDVTALTRLTRLEILGGTIESVDLSNNSELTYVSLKEMNLNSLDASGLSKLASLYLNENTGITATTLQLPTEKSVLQSFYVQGTGIEGAVDLREYTALKYVSMPYTNITSLDVRGLYLGSLFVQDCPNLTTVLVDSAKTCNIRNTHFTPATLPVFGVKTYTYYPLLPYEIPAAVQAGESIDLSSQYIVLGDTSTYTWKYIDGSVVDASYYTEDKGVFTFKVAPKDTVYCEITVPAYPKLKGNNAYVTTKTVADGAKEIMTMTAEPGKVLDFELTCATAGQTMYIDWGDGVVQQYDSIATADDWSATNPMDTVRGEGNIKIYGDASQLTIFETIWSAPYYEDEVAGSKITAIDLSKVTELTKLTIQSHDLATLDVTALTKLTRISILGGTIEGIDLSKNTELTSVNLKEMNLLSVDLSGLSKMTTIYLNDNANLTTANLVMPTEKGVLQSFYVQGTGIDGAVDLREYTALKYVSMPNTQIASLDVRGLNLTSLFVQDCPNLTTVLVDSVKTTFNIRNNNFTPATLPVLNVKNYYCDPLPAYEIPAEVQAGESIDLSSQYIVCGDTSTYTWKYIDGSVVDASNYAEDKGVFTFKVAPKDTVYCEITVPAYPRLKDDNAYVTTKTVIIPGASAIDAAEEQVMTLYTSKGCIVVENVSAIVTLYSGITGQVVAEKSGAPKVVFDGLQPGLYIVKCDNKAVKAIVR